MNIKNIGIAGLGLIGGSFARAFYEQGLNIYGFDKDEKVLIAANATEIFECLTDKIEDFLLFDLDLIYICLPVMDGLELIRYFGEKRVKIPLTDALSTKLSISKLSKKYELNFCGGHPIGGREKSGFKHSDINILKGVCHILTGPKGQLFDALWQLHESIGMKLIYMDPSMHDEIFGIVSHLPHLIAFSLVETVSKVNEDALDYAGAGFKDFTRIAGSSDIMWSNIFLDNRDNLLLLIDNYVDNLKSWRDLINKSKIKDLREKISKVSNKRRILK